MWAARLRDTLLGHPQSDYDIATSATPEQVQRLFPRTVARWDQVRNGGRAGLATGHCTRSPPSAGTYPPMAGTPWSQYGVSLDDDLARRDFTINAIAYHPLRYEWRDPVGGEQDLEGRLVRAVGDPAQRLPKTICGSCGHSDSARGLSLPSIPTTWNAARAAAPGPEAALRRTGARRVVQGPADRDSLFSSFASFWREAGAAAGLDPRAGSGMRSKQLRSRRLRSAIQCC